MHAQIHTIASCSIETIASMVQIHTASGLPAIALGLMVAIGVVPRGAFEDARVCRSFGLSGDAVACVGRVIAFDRIPCQRRNINAC